jgi:hypothetical protein
VAVGGNRGRRAKRVNGTKLACPGQLQARGADVEIQVTERARVGVGRQPAAMPVRRRRRARRTHDRPRRQRPVAAGCVRHTRARRHQRRGELGQLVHDDIRPPRRDHAFQIRSARFKLEPDENLGEEEAATCVGGENVG